MRAWLSRAKRLANDASGLTVAEVLDQIGEKIAEGVQDAGGVVVSTSEAGGSVSFAFPQGHSPHDLAVTNEAAKSLAVRMGLAKAEDFIVPPARMVTRLRADFRRAAL